MSDRLTLFFEPLDVLQFRDYRPFDAGFNVLGQSVFPLPGVFLGCVRSALFRDQGADFRCDDEYFGVKERWAQELLGSRKRAGSLQLCGPLVARLKHGEFEPGESWPARKAGPPLVARLKHGKLEPYFPKPADLVTVKDAGAGKTGNKKPVSRYVVLACKSTDAGDAPYFYHRQPGEASMVQQKPALPWTGHELDKPRGGPMLLTTKGAREYCEHSRESNEPFELEERKSVDKDHGHVIRQDQVLVTEDRFGVTRNPNTLTVVPQRFYLQRPYRLARHHGFAVEVLLPEDENAVAAIRRLDGRIVQLGGRGHRARVSVLNHGLIPAGLRASGPANKLWFLTPAPLAPRLGQWPTGMNVVAERVQEIGGFDQAARRPRPLLRALPAGTVVYPGARDIEAVKADLCGFPADASTDGEHIDELQRLQRAGFAMALHVGAEKG